MKLAILQKYTFRNCDLSMPLSMAIVVVVHISKIENVLFFRDETLDKIYFNLIAIKSIGLKSKLALLFGLTATAAKIGNQRSKMIDSFGRVHFFNNSSADQ